MTMQGIEGKAMFQKITRKTPNRKRVK